VTTPFLGRFVVRRLGLAMNNMHIKFEVSGLRCSRDILEGLKNLKWVTWRDHFHFRDGLLSLGCDCYVEPEYQSVPSNVLLRPTGAASWQTGRNVRVVFDSSLFAPLFGNTTSSTKLEVHDLIIALSSEKDRASTTGNIWKTARRRRWLKKK